MPIHRWKIWLTLTTIGFLVCEPILQLPLAHGANAVQAASETEVDDAPPDTTPQYTATLKGTIDKLVNYSDFTRKTKMNAKDRDYLERWLPIGQALKAETDAHPEENILTNYYASRVVPKSIITKYHLNQTDIQDLPALDVYLVNVIRNLLTDSRLEIDGAYGSNHEYLDISRLVKDFDTKAKEISTEGERKPQFKDLEDKVISGHSKDHAKAADFAALDTIRCTQVTYQLTNQGKPDKIKKKQKLGEPIPIEFTWQAKQPNQNPPGPLSPSSLLDAFGASINDFIKIDFTKAYLPELARMINDGGFSVGSATNLLRDEKLSSLNPKIFYSLIGQAGIKNELAGTLYGQYLRFRRNLPESVDATGAAILAQNFIQLAPEALLAPTLDAAAEINARKILGGRLFGRGFSFEGFTVDDLFTNFAYQYTASKIFDLTTTNELKQLPVTNALAVRSSLGRIAASQWLGISLDDLRDKKQANLVALLGDRLSHPLELDQQFGIPEGTTNDFIENHKTADQYFEVIGDVVIHDSLDNYANDRFVRARAFGLEIGFMGTDDLYYPTEPTYPTINDTVTEINRFYRQGPVKLISDNDWLAFVDLATAVDRRVPGHTGTITTGLENIDFLTADAGRSEKLREEISHLPDRLTLEERDEILKERLYEILKDPIDFIDRLIAGQATPADFLDLGYRITARALTQQPFHQLALYHYLKSTTHEIWTIPIKVDTPSDLSVTAADFLLAEHRAPVFDPDQLAIDKLGFLPGYLDWLVRDNAFSSVLLPFFATNLFIQATGNAPPENGFLTNLPRIALWSDTFLTETLTALRQTVPETDQTKAFRTRLASLTANDWKEEILDSREQKIDRLTHELLESYQTLQSQFTAAQKTDFDKIFAGLVAGQNLASITNLSPPSISTNQGVGLTPTTLQSLLSGEKSPRETSRLLGANLISRFVLDADDPAAMSQDLLTVAKDANQYTLRGFFNTYEGKLQDVARLVNKGLNLQTDQGITGQTILSFLSGNRPIFNRVGSSMAHEALTGLPGSIINAAGEKLTEKIGIGNFFATAGFTKTPVGTSGQDIQKETFQQFSGLQLAESASEFLKINDGPKIFEKLGASASVVQQVRKTWNPADPTATLQLLGDPNFWKKVPVDQGFANLFTSDVGRGVSTAFQGMFTKGGQPTDLLGPIAAGAAVLFKDKIKGVDVSGIVSAIQNGGDAKNAFINFGQTALTSRFGDKFSGVGDLARLITNQGSSKEIITWGITNLPKIFGDTSFAPTAQLGSQLFSFFKQSQYDPKSILGIATQIGQFVKIPIASDIGRMFNSPTGLGLSLASRMIASQHNNAFGGEAFHEVRHALFGPTTEDFAKQGKKTIEGMAGKPGVTDAAKGLTPGKRQKAVNEKTTFDMKTVTKKIQESVNYATIDALGGLNKGFTEAMLKGDSKAKIDALFGEAGQFLPPEARPLAEAFRGYFKGEGFKLDGVLDSMYGLSDSYLSQAIGIPLPRDFTKQVVGLFDGKTNIADFQKNMGNFAIGAVSGFLDQKVGLPVGTSYAIYQGATQLVDLSAKVATAQAAFEQSSNVLNRASLDLAKADLKAFQGELAGMAVSLIFGKQLSQMDQALGLPPGTASFLVSSAVTSLFGGGAFLSVLAAAAPWFVAGLIIGEFLGDVLDFLGDLFGFGGDDNKPQIVCSPGGYYPYITKVDDERQGLEPTSLYDPNPNIGCQKSAKECRVDDLGYYRYIHDRLKPEEVRQKLNLSPGYVGEFIGEEGFPEQDPKTGKITSRTYEEGKKATARWKIRELTGELLGMQLPDKFGANTESGIDRRYQPSQIILYKIPDFDSQTTKDQKLDLSYDGDYLLSFDSRPLSVGAVQPTIPATLKKLPPFDRQKTKDQEGDTRFMDDLTVGGTGSLTKVIVGILDWKPEDGGYGNGQPGSMQYLHELDAPDLNRGVWAEDGEEYWHHLHLTY